MPRSPYSPEVRERAVRMYFDHRPEYPSEWAAMTAIAGMLGMTPETLRKWVRRAEIDNGERAGLTTDERARLKALEKENRELRRANEMADSTGGRNELCELLRWCQIAESLAWSGVQTALNAAQLGGRDLGEVRPLGEILAEEAIGVLVRSTLPR